MPLMSIVIPLIVVGVLLYVVNTYIPMDASIKSILNVVVILAVVFWVLHAFGLLPYSGPFRVGTLPFGGFPRWA